MLKDTQELDFHSFLLKKQKKIFISSRLTNPKRQNTQGHMLLKTTKSEGKSHCLPQKFRQTRNYSKS